MKKNKHIFSKGMANFTTQSWGKIILDIDSLPKERMKIREEEKIISEEIVKKLTGSNDIIVIDSYKEMK